MRTTAAAAALAALALAAGCAGCGGSGARGIAFGAAEGRLALEVAEALVRERTPRDAGTVEGRLAADWICAKVGELGVEAKVDAFEAPVPGGTAWFANVEAELRGTDPEGAWVVVMSHFDTMPGIGEGFQGANDGASTTGLLAALAAAAKKAGPFRENLLFCWTDGEECRKAYGPDDGFQGSKRLARKMLRARRKVKAAICLDMLGDRDLHIEVPGNVSHSLASLAASAAQRAGASGKLSFRPGLTVWDDHKAFADLGMPAVVLIDFQYGSAPGKNDWWHTMADTTDKLSAESLETSGAIAAEMINALAAAGD